MEDSAPPATWTASRVPRLVAVTALLTLDAFAVAAYAARVVAPGVWDRLLVLGLVLAGALAGVALGREEAQLGTVPGRGLLLPTMLGTAGAALAVGFGLRVALGPPPGDASSPYVGVATVAGWALGLPLALALSWALERRARRRGPLAPPV